MNGVLNIDKPAGMTSHDVVARVRRVAKLKRVGHAGNAGPGCDGRAAGLPRHGHAAV